MSLKAWLSTIAWYTSCENPKNCSLLTISPTNIPTGWNTPSSSTYNSDPQSPNDSFLRANENNCLKQCHDQANAFIATAAVLCQLGESRASWTMRLVKPRTSSKFSPTNHCTTSTPLLESVLGICRNI